MKITKGGGCEERDCERSEEKKKKKKGKGDPKQPVYSRNKASTRLKFNNFSSQITCCLKKEVNQSHRLFSTASWQGRTTSSTLEVVFPSYPTQPRENT
ncbi:hypothetical protein CEXT_209941 [Caerostris extrusa]|uniref:Uncharacterized protein n=1 Tax=Caerostris extrusa TaxID=172846 RepID=A0AAV4V0P4_CAEEX|nr:hypothetical protein CEXT_209941 [Caerostris extrusa]